MTVSTGRFTTPHASAEVYHTPAQGSDSMDTYYFACHTCGNCGRRWTGRKPAAEEAMTHVAEHPPYQLTQRQTQPLLEDQ
jgi:hypothetical protein